MNLEGVVMHLVIEVKDAIKVFYEAKFKSPNTARPMLQSTIQYKLNEQENRSLEESFTREEIRQVIFEGNGDKCLGPDDFNLDFLKNFWDTVGEEIVLFMQEFHRKCKLSKAVTASFLALIPKHDRPLMLEDYRSICLISSMLKIISRILVVMLRKVIGTLISNNQTAFVPR